MGTTGVPNSRTMERAGLPVWRSLPTKIAAVMAGFALFVTTIGGTFALQQLRRVQTQALRDHANGTAGTVSRLVGPALEFDALEEAEQSLAAVSADPQIAAVVVRDRAGRIWASVGEVPSGEGLIAAVASVKDLGQTSVGTVQVAIDPNALLVHRRAAATGFWTILVLTAAGLLVCSLAARRLTVPLLQVAAAAQRMAQGEISAPLRLKKHRYDEVGIMSEAFANMQDRLHRLYEAQARVGAGDLADRNLGAGPLFEGFRAMVADLAKSRDRDVEQRRALEAARADAEEANAAKGRFLARVSHEMRTPLNAILGLNEILGDPDGAAEDRDADLQSQRTQIDIALRMVDGVLSFAAVEEGEIQIREQAFDPVGTVARLVERAQVRADAKVTVVFESDDVPARVRTDGQRFEQVLGHLVDNAVKFTDRGRIHVRLRGREGALWVAVKDTGRGIPQAIQSKIFEPFARADANGLEHRGLGVGIALSQRVLSAMGSSLHIESEEGVGTTVSFLLPVAEITPGAPSAVEGEDAPPSEVTDAVLVVEDDRLNQRVILRHLAALGIDASLVENGQEAVDALRQAPYGLVFMDCMMPVLDGYDATRQIRAEEATRRRTPIVAVTANAMPGDREKCLYAGMDDYLAKPIRRADLKAKLDRWLVQPAGD